MFLGMTQVQTKSKGQILGLGVVSREFDSKYVVSFYFVCYKKTRLLISALSKSPGMDGPGFSPVLYAVRGSGVQSTLGPGAGAQGAVSAPGSNGVQKLHRGTRDVILESPR